MDLSQKQIAYYHLPGLFEFYELYSVFCRCFGHTENTFMIGAGSVRSMEPRRTASGAVDVHLTASRIRGQCWH